MPNMVRVEVPACNVCHTVPAPHHYVITGPDGPREVDLCDDHDISQQYEAGERPQPKRHRVTHAVVPITEALKDANTE